MDKALLIITLVVAIVPLVLLAGIAIPRAASLVQFALLALALGLGLLFAWLVFPRDLVSVWYRAALLIAGYLVMIGLFGYLVSKPLSGYLPPEQAVAPLYAPCDGRVVLSVEVVLAHMRNGRVRVSAGDPVTVDTLLGEVGNSGNTSEPHLHMHAERGGPRGVILDGEPVAMLVDGCFLVRGDRL